MDLVDGPHTPHSASEAIDVVAKCCNFKHSYLRIGSMIRASRDAILRGFSRWIQKSGSGELKRSLWVTSWDSILVRWCHPLSSTDYRHTESDPNDRFSVCEWQGCIQESLENRYLCGGAWDVNFRFLANLRPQHRALLRRWKSTFPPLCIYLSELEIEHLLSSLGGGRRWRMWWDAFWWVNWLIWCSMNFDVILVQSSALKAWCALYRHLGRWPRLLPRA